MEVIKVSGNSVGGGDEGGYMWKLMEMVLVESLYGGGGDSEVSWGSL